MYSIIIPITGISNLVLNNARVLAQEYQVKQILLVNISGSIVELDANIPRTEILQLFNMNVYDAMSKTIKEYVTEDKVILLDSNIQVNKKFVTSLTKHYAKNHLYTFRVNEIYPNNSVIVDPRIGNKVDVNTFNVCAVAFNKAHAIDVGCFNRGDLIHFAYKMETEGVKLQLLNQVLVHKVTKDDELVKDVEKKVVAGAVVPREKKKEIFNITIGVQNKIKYSIIIPFMYNGDRYEIFEASIKRLYELLKEKDDIEIIIHETSPNRHLTQDFIEKYNLVYMYSKWEEVFHCAWALNIPSKHIALGDVFVFFDGDLLVTKDWVDELYNIDPSKIYFGWGKMFNMTEQTTKTYLKNGHIGRMMERVRYPDINSSAGGINIIPKNIFLKIHGWDESFRGTYGGADNSFCYKLKTLGYDITNHFNSGVYHLYHAHQTPRSSKRFTIFKKIRSYNRNKWLHHINSVEWGRLCEGIKFNTNTISVCIASIPEREKQLKNTINSIIDNTDYIFIYLNNYKTVPDFITNNDKIHYRQSNDFCDIKAAGKFFWISEISNGYVFTIDDDIIYPKDYIDKMVDTLKKYKNKAVITVHGSIFGDPLFWYFGKNRVFGFQRSLETDKFVTLVGTGTILFHRKSINMSFIDFFPNVMCDLTLSIKSYTQNIPMISIKRDSLWLKQQPVDKESSYYIKMLKDDEGRTNTAQQIDWSYNKYSGFISDWIEKYFSIDEFNEIDDIDTLFIEDISSNRIPLNWDSSKSRTYKMKMMEFYK